MTSHADFKLASLALKSSLLIALLVLLEGELYSVNHKYQPWSSLILIIWAIISQLLQIILLKVLCTPKIFSPCECTFETYKAGIPYGQLIQRSTPRGGGLPCPTIISGMWFLWFLPKFWFSWKKFSKFSLLRFV